MPTEAQKRARNKWGAENRTVIGCKMRREDAEAFKAAAQEDGTNPNELLRGWIGDYMSREESDMTNDQIQALATIFAICRKATKTQSQSDIDNSQRFPIKWATIMVRKLHAMGKATEEIDRAIAEQYGKIDIDTFTANFDKCLTLEQQGVWSLAFYKAMQ